MNIWILSRSIPICLLRYTFFLQGTEFENGPWSDFCYLFVKKFAGTLWSIERNFAAES